jgi:hypothetical protein
MTIAHGRNAGAGVMTMEYCDKAPRRRDQIVLFAPTLDESISNDHPVRLLEEILCSRDWSVWEVEYDDARGRPPIPPWGMAGVILYAVVQKQLPLFNSTILCSTWSYEA